MIHIYPTAEFKIDKENKPSVKAENNGASNSPESNQSLRDNSYDDQELK